MIPTKPSTIQELLKSLTFYNEKQLNFYQNYFQKLLNQNACFRCCLRFAGKSIVPLPSFLESTQFNIVTRTFASGSSSTAFLSASPTSHGHEFRRKPDPSKPAVEADKLDQEEKSTVKMNVQSQKDQEEDPVPCPSCLGLLQIDMDQLAHHLLEKFQQQNFVLQQNTFKLSIRLPFQLPIRQVGMDHYLKEQFKDANLDEQDALLLSQMNVLDVKEIFKTLLKSSFSKISGMEFDTNSPLSLVIHLSHEETEHDYEFLTDIPEAKFQVKKSKKRGKTLYQGASAEKISKAVKCVSVQDFKNANHCPSPQIKSMPSISFNSQDTPPACFFQHSSIYVAGRYCKLKRHISNSAWVINGKRMTEDSMEELIGDFLPLTFGNESYKFSSAGREDSDVLMLGDGRPFYFELIHPKVGLVSQESLTKLEKKINDNVDGKIKVFDLQLVSLEDTSILKNSAATKSKSYMCLVELENPVSLEKINELSGKKNLIIAQRNPTRVPRRADMVREKVIESIVLHPQESAPDGSCKKIMVDLQTSAGAYVKEFMHGDDGRTVPCLSSILECGAVKVLSLDVSKVHLDWPNRITSLQQDHQN